jgi:ATP-binding cassette, subfamily B, bacterial MsbA
MNTYNRILLHARPWRRFLPGYVVFSLLSVGFGLVNMTLLKPLFDVIFEQVGPEKLGRFAEKPVPALSFDYINDLFNHYMFRIETDHGKFGALVYVCGIIIASFLISNIFRFLSSVVLAKVRILIVRNLRLELFRKVTLLDVGYFTEQRKGDIMSRITSDVQQIDVSLSQNLKVFFREPVTIVVYFGLLFVTSYSLTLFTLLLLPVSGVAISAIVKRLRRSAIDVQASLGRLLNILDETLGGIRVIKAFNAIPYINRVFKKEVSQFSHAELSWSVKYELSSPVSEFLGAVSIAGILLYGGHLVLIEKSLEASSFMMFIAVFTQVLQPAKAIANSISHFQRGIASGQRVFELLDTEPAIKNKPDARKLQSFEREIEFRNVTFTYGDKAVLKNVSFTIPKGKTVALVGPSGGGKTTLANLLPRFFDPTSGEVLIDGVPLTEYDFYSLREHMGIVTQESILFNDTVFNNIAFGVQDVRPEDVERVALIANAHRFIAEHEEGYGRVIGERGTKLSGGQRQRITIARALLKNPPILILDEATSALDSESEMLVQEAINNLMKNRTSLVIAHRLSTIQHADEILVIDRGEIAERGQHRELLRAGGLYSKLTGMQGLGDPA